MAARVRPWRPALQPLALMRVDSPCVGTLSAPGPWKTKLPGNALRPGQHAWAAAAKLLGESQVPAVSGPRPLDSPIRRRGRYSALMALGFFELVFEDDDAAGGLDGSSVVDEFPGRGGVCAVGSGSSGGVRPPSAVG